MSERTQIEQGPVRLQPIVQHGLQILRAGVVVEVERAQPRRLTYSRIKRFRAFDRHEADVKRLGALCLGEFLGQDRSSRAQGLMVQTPEMKVALRGASALLQHVEFFTRAVDAEGIIGERSFK